jgi:hypothetical protein
MGMTGIFRLVRPAALEEARFDPDLLGAMIFEPGDEDEESDDDPGGSLEIDKSWHGLHFLLTGTAWEGQAPLDFIVRGGDALDLDPGYGPVRYFDPAALKLIARAIHSLDERALKSRYDATRMQKLDIYPQIWLREDNADDYLLENWSLLRSFIENGSAEGFGMLVCIA